MFRALSEIVALTLFLGTLIIWSMLIGLPAPF